MTGPELDALIDGLRVPLDQEAKHLEVLEQLRASYRAQPELFTEQRVGLIKHIKFKRWNAQAEEFEWEMMNVSGGKVKLIPPNFHSRW